MTQEHPITPPTELVQQWAEQMLTPDEGNLALDFDWFATQAARWGADQELEACCEWLDYNYPPVSLNALRSARRLKPTSLKEQALGALYAMATGADDTREFYQDIETIKSALEQLDD